MLRGRKTAWVQEQGLSLALKVFFPPGVRWDALVFWCPIGPHGILSLLVEWLQLGVLARNDVVPREGGGLP